MATIGITAARATTPKRWASTSRNSPAEAEAAWLSENTAKCRRQTSKGETPRSSAAAIAVNPELTRKCRPAMAASGNATASTVVSGAPSGPRSTRNMKACAPTHSPRAGLAVLNRIRSTAWLRRHETRNPSTAMAAVAGAGPKRMTDVNRKVSDIEACTGTPGTRSVNDPQATARMPRSSHSGVRSMAGSCATDWAMAKRPATVTAATKRDSTRFGPDSRAARAGVIGGIPRFGLVRGNRAARSQPPASRPGRDT